VLDSLTAVRPLRARGIDRVVDLGSGGGFPGIPLAAALPADRALLVDSIGKKARFLATVVGATGLGGRAAVEAARSETLAAGSRDRGRWPAVTARAVAPLAELVELALPLLEPGGSLIAWKAASAIDGGGPELAAARRAIAALDPSAELSVEPALGGAADAADPALAALADHRLVIVRRHADRIDGRWPRDPATRKRGPW
jgi:16S rRNA (guanine527-N7)-methyltransferase